MSPSSLLECASMVTCTVHAHPHTYAYVNKRIKHCAYTHIHIHTYAHAPQSHIGTHVSF